MLRDGPFTPYWRVAIYGPWGTLKLQDWTLQDWTLTDDFTGVDIAGLDIDGRICGQLTELKLQNFIS